MRTNSEPFVVDHSREESVIHVRLNTTRRFVDGVYKYDSGVAYFTSLLTGILAISLIFTHRVKIINTLTPKIV